MTGAWLWGGGDLDLDGLPDYLVSAPYLNQVGEDAGGVYVVTTVLEDDTHLSEAHALLLGEAEDDSAGQSAAISSDLDGDGHADVLVGADDESSVDTNQGAVYVWRGPVEPGTWSLTDADAKLVGRDNNTYMIDAEHAGVRVAALDDIDGDGLADFAIGATDYWPGDTDDVTGAAYVVTGWVEGTVSLADADHFLMSRETVQAGFGLASPGDLDGDGTGDLAIGSLGDSAYLDHAGAMFYLSGASIVDRGPEIDLEESDAILYGASEGANFGYAISTAGDLHGNGFDDLLVTAKEEDDGGEQAGAVYVVFGPLEGEGVIDDHAAATFLGEAPDDYAGLDVDGGVDVDGDGLLYFVTGAWTNDRGGNYAGVTYLISGGDFL